jgi:hypothetical protein
MQGGKHRPSSAPNPLLGDVLVVLAQLLAATQFIVEEKFLSKYHAPVLMAGALADHGGSVGWRGGVPLPMGPRCGNPPARLALTWPCIG